MNEAAVIPAQARIVIIGGGIIGCSTAYHLAQMGCNDVVLLEKHRLTSGSTFHAAGLVGQLRTNANITQLLGYSVELYRKLEQETGLATGWKMNGGLRLACNEQRWLEVKRQATTAHSFGLDMHLLSAREALDMGLINRVMPEGQHLDAALETARTIAVMDRDAMRLTKHAVNRSFEIMGMREALQMGMDIDVQIESMVTPERQEFGQILKEKGLKAALKTAKKREFIYTPASFQSPMSTRPF